MKEKENLTKIKSITFFFSESDLNTALNELHEFFSGMRERFVLIREGSYGEQSQLANHCQLFGVHYAMRGRVAPFLSPVSSSAGCPTLNHFKSSFP